MAIPERKILSPKGRPSRPLREIRAAIRKVAAAAAAAHPPKKQTLNVVKKKSTAKSNG